MGGIRLFTEKVRGQCKSVSCRDRAVHVLVILNLLDLRIYLAIAADIRQSVRLRGVGQPIRRQAQIIVLVVARRFNGFRGYAIVGSLEIHSTNTAPSSNNRACRRSEV